MLFYLEEKRGLEYDVIVFLVEKVSPLIPQVHARGFQGGFFLQYRKAFTFMLALTISTISHANITNGIYAMSLYSTRSNTSHAI